VTCVWLAAARYGVPAEDIEIPSCDHFSRRFSPASCDRSCRSCRCTSAGLRTRGAACLEWLLRNGRAEAIRPVPREAPVPRFAGYTYGRCRGTEQQITVVSLHLPSANVRSAKPQGSSVERERGLEAGGPMQRSSRTASHAQALFIRSATPMPPFVSGVSHREPIVRVPAYNRHGGHNANQQAALGP
jgi:hypothetical protein